MPYKDKEKEKQRLKKYYAEHRAEVLERSKLWYQEHKDHVKKLHKQYLEERGDEIRARNRISNRKYKAENRDKILKDNKAYRERNKEQIKLASKEYHIKNRISCIYKGMIARCRNTTGCYKDIFVCKYWLNNKQAFCDWWKERDPDNDPQLSIDRIDPRYEYAPYNCQLITMSENGRKSSYDKKRTEEELESAKREYEERRSKWLKEMSEQGLSVDELI